MVPETMWCIDQFGQSMTASRLARLLGYNQMVFARMSEGIANNLRNSGDLMLKWQHSDHSSDATMIYKMPKHYETSLPIRIDNGIWSDLN